MEIEENAVRFIVDRFTAWVHTDNGDRAVDISRRNGSLDAAKSKRVFPSERRSRIWDTELVGRLVPSAAQNVTPIAGGIGGPFFQVSCHVVGSERRHASVRPCRRGRLP